MRFMVALCVAGTAIMICYWDGIVHFIMYLMMIQCLWNTVSPCMSYHTLGLFWAGSLFANISVFVTGIVAHYDQSFSLIWHPTDLFLVLLIPGTMSFTLFRSLVALDSPLEACSVYLGQYEPYLKDPVGYPKILHFLFYMLPMLGAYVYGLVPGCTWMPDWTVGTAQCQWAHIGASLHPRTVVPFQILGKSFLAVLAANLLGTQKDM
ncbi:LOW QUALITY PROTEIN: transmembrane 6 superfamily member 2 [Salvelinus alpinus]